MPQKSTYEELEKRVQELEQAENELAQIFSMSLDMISIADINTATFIKVNPAFTEILGHSNEELLDKPFLDLVHPEDIDATRTVIERKLKSGAKVINFENRYRCKDGSYRWLSWVGHPNIEKGIAYSVARDITEWKQNEEELKKSKDLLDATGRMARVGGWELDADTLQVTWTDETYRLHEVPYKHKLDLNEAINFFHPRDREKLAQCVERALKEGTPYDMELRFTTANGKELWMRTKCYPQIENSKTVKLLGTFQDITERKLAELSVLEAEEKFSTVFHASPAYITFTTFEEGRFVMVNEAFTEVIGYERHEVLGKTTVEIGLWSDAENRTRYMDQASQYGGFRDLEVTFKRKDGSQLVGLWSAKKISLQDKVYLVNVFVDITKRKQTELALDRRVKFERLIGRISSNFIELGVREIDTNIEAALASIGDFTGADRAYVFQFRADGDLMDNTHEWCAEGVSPEIDHLQGIKLSEELPWLAEEIQRCPSIYVSDVNALPIEAVLEKEHFKVQRIRSLIAVPMRVEGQLIGLVGFDAVRECRFWSEEDQTVLRFAGEILANALERKRKEVALRELEEQVRQTHKMEAIGNLAGGIAHEFNNVLGIILGNAELALDDVPDWNPAKESLKEIRNASFRA
ncbi:MAG: PAS domain S-box protein, partial [Deltaproteobacteria bacterium]|nr:PAS domain S-box protein [Deltaproteobacteria bacterium]